MTAKRDKTEVSTKDKLKSRNTRSAHMSRVKIKFEVKLLNLIRDTTNQSIEDFLDIVGSALEEADQPELLA